MTVSDHEQSLTNRLLEAWQVARKRRPKAPDLQRQLTGLLVASVVIVGLDLFSAGIHFIPKLGTLYLILVVGLALNTGFWSAAGATVLLTAHVWLVHRFHIPPYGDSSVYGPITAKHPINVSRDLLGTVVLYGFFAMVIGITKDRFRKIRIREYDAKSGLRSSEELRQLIVDSSLDAVVVVRGDGRIDHWSPNAEALFGWSEPEVLGRPLVEVVVPTAFRASLQSTLAQYAETGEGRFLGRRLELTGLTKGGVEIAVEASIVAHRRENETLFIGFLRDITERKRADEAIRELNARLEERVVERTKQLEQANEELTGFNYSVSHDLRAPLRAIVGHSRILLEEAPETLDAESRVRLKRVEMAALKMSDLIESLLQFARVGQVALREREVDLTALAENVAAELKAMRAGEVLVQQGMKAFGDPDMLRLVVLNLLENAWKYVSPDASPRVEIGQTADGTFFVRDHGIGFDMQYVDKIWEPFERLHRDTDYPGTGIGLANCRRIVRRHGGRMDAHSSPGEGTTIFFTLPSVKVSVL